MGYLKYVKALYKKPKANLGTLYRERLIKWRREDTVTKIENPTRIDRARSIGYKAKKGFFVARVRVNRGNKMRPRFMGGRKPKTSRRTKVLEINYQRIAEEKAARRYRNAETLGSYWVARDGTNYWFEVVLGDREILKTYPEYKNWIMSNVGRVFRGKTSASRA